MADDKQLELPFNIKGICAAQVGKDCTIRRPRGRPRKLSPEQVCKSAYGIVNDVEFANGAKCGRLAGVWEHVYTVRRSNTPAAFDRTAEICTVCGAVGNPDLPADHGCTGGAR